MSSVTDPTPLHATEKAADAHAGHGHGEHWVHISDWQTLVKVWVALMVLTFLTVAATWVNLGTANIWIAMGVAVAKATLVVLYFMHMKYNKPFLAYVFTFSLAFVAFFLAMVMLDSKHYQDAVDQRRLDDPDQTVVKPMPPMPPNNPGPGTPAPTK